MKKKILTQERLKELLDYNPDTGLFSRKIAIAAEKAGPMSLRPDRGYTKISIDCKKYYAHRLAWFYIHGYFPEHGLDHINRNRQDNRIKNLREASKTCNARNTGNLKTNTSGVKGVNWLAQKKKWRVRINVNTTDRHIGIFSCFAEAVCHRLSAEQCLGWSGCDSLSPAYQYVQQNVINRLTKEAES